MVKTLHSAGIEVILDVVYNHTAEGNQLGPTLSLPRHRQRVLLPARSRTSRATTSTSPAAATRSTCSTRACCSCIMDSLRYWVDRDARRRLPLRPRLGARARAARGRPPRRASSTSSRQDPVLTQVKLIAEPWDLGEGGYQVGNFPPGWAEWNDKYRDTMRAYWKGDGGLIGEFAQRLTGSSDLYGAQRPAAAREHQLRHRARRLHAARPRVATTTSTTRPTARTTATATTTTCRGTAASKGRPTIRRSSRCASARSATSSRRCCSRRACRCCSRGDELGRTQQRQQQRLLPGQRDLAGSTGTLDDARTRAARLRAPHDRAAPRAPDLPPPRLLPGPAAARRAASRTSSGSSPTAAR